MSDRNKPLSPLRVTPQPVLKIPKSERTRAAILNAALDFLWSQAFRDMTVNAVMAPAGASRAAFYQYFGDLHTLMETLLDMVQEEIFDA
jgi:AcrR family transcriptional regulator